MSDLPDEMSFGGPSPQDVANGTAILASALVREAEALASAAAGMRGSLDVLDDTPGQRMVQASAVQAATLAGALSLVARLLLHFTGDAERAAQEAAAGLPRGAVSGRTILGHLRAASLAPVTDDGAARIAAAIVAETFAMAFDAAWRDAPGGQGD
ncbi:hypothetical protein GXW78_00170 [Roseomonas terrae]|uniref:Uncharacterized protein n=1 Tax=Neoroseomonas terrae TaxID=424799 RepID=A0ABS5EAL8_9PROT|nr:hypothetical protein [Neoroseomonas terrae]MBR0648061.1 hypothetical protein [Neoroseomonas terrae]